MTMAGRSTSLLSSIAPYKELPESSYGLSGSCNDLICNSDDCFGSTYAQSSSGTRRSESTRSFRCLGSVLMATACTNLRFGYDPIKDDYKVVRISYIKNNGPERYEFTPKVEVLSEHRLLERHNRRQGFQPHG